MSGRRPNPQPHVLIPPSLLESGTSGTPRDNASKRGAAKRKQTLLSLLDALNELTNEEEAFPKGELHSIFVLVRRLTLWPESTLEPSFQDDHDVRKWSRSRAYRDARG